MCLQNFKDGEETIKTALRDAWIRKKAMRESMTVTVNGDVKLEAGVGALKIG